MIFRLLARYFANNEHLVNKLADSYPIRRTAQWAVYLFTQSKAASNEALSKQPLFRNDGVLKALRQIKDQIQDKLKK